MPVYSLYSFHRTFIPAFEYLTPSVSIQVTCSKLLQRSKGWSDFIPDRRIIWRLLKRNAVTEILKYALNKIEKNYDEDGRKR